jgi:hypothetical protein
MSGVRHARPAHPPRPARDALLPDLSALRRSRAGRAFPPAPLALVTGLEFSPPSPHASRIQLANNAGLRETLVVGGPGRVTRRLCPVTLHPSRGTRDGYPVRPSPRILPLQAGIAPGRVSPEYSRVLRESFGLGPLSEP